MAVAANELKLKAGQAVRKRLAKNNDFVFGINFRPVPFGFAVK
jgi:hypothetical protein